MNYYRGRTRWFSDSILLAFREEAVMAIIIELGPPEVDNPFVEYVWDIDLASGVADLVFTSEPSDDPFTSYYDYDATVRYWSVDFAQPVTWASIEGKTVASLITDGATLLAYWGKPARIKMTNFDENVSGSSYDDSIDGRGGDDHLLGDSGDDTLLGGDRDDTLDGGNGEDVLQGGAGNDKIVGSDDDGEEYYDDTAAYSGKKSDYSLKYDGVGSWTITDKRAGKPDGVDTLKNIDFLKFSDMTVSIEEFGNVPPTDIELSTTVAENSPIGTVVGVLSSTDPDTTAFTYVLIDDAGGRFKIAKVGGLVCIVVAGKIDYEKASLHVVTVEVSDGDNAYSEPFAIFVRDLAEGEPENPAGDAFRFEKLKPAVTVADFDSADGDKLELLLSAFPKLKKTGPLKAKFFDSGNARADDKNDYLIYHKKKGALYYDEDGSRKAHDPVKFAILDGKPKLSHRDFVIFEDA